MSHLSEDDLVFIKNQRTPMGSQRKMNLAKDIADNIFPSDGSTPTSQHEITEWLERLGIEALWAQPDDTTLLCCLWRYTEPINNHVTLDRFIIAFVGYDSLTIQIFNLGEEGTYD